MTFKVTELMTPNPHVYCSIGCGPTIPEDPTSFCTWATEDATGYQGEEGGRRKAQSEERLALLRAELRRAIALH